MTEIFDDIRKLYQFKNPCPELADYIEFFSETSLDATLQYIDKEAFTVKLFPSFTPTIWLNLGSPYHLKSGEQCRLIDEKTDVLLLRNTIVERRNLPTDNIFTIKFFPSGFEAIFGISQTKIGNEIINVNEIISPWLIKKLKEMDSLEEKIALLEGFFLEKIKKNNLNQHYFKSIKYALENYFQSGMESKNSELAHQLCITEKTFYRYFKNTIGTNPKNYLSIVRARTALTAYKNHKAGFSPYDFGYYVYGHFSKDVVKFTGAQLSSF